MRPTLLKEVIYLSSQKALAQHLSAINLQEKFNVFVSKSYLSVHMDWALYENTINQIISLPYSEERLALVTYLYLNHGTFPPALHQALATQNRSRIWFALLTAETEQVTQKQCAHLAEVFGLFDADYAEQDSGDEVNETRTIYCF